MKLRIRMPPLEASKPHHVVSRKAPLVAPCSIHTAIIRKADSTTLIQVLFVPPMAACLNVCFASDREFKFIIQDFRGIV